MIGVVVLFGGVRASTCPLAPKLFHRLAADSGGVSVKAVELGNSIGFDERSLAWHAPEVHVGHPWVATVCIGKAKSPVPPSCWERPAVGSTGRPAVCGHAAVLDALKRGLYTNTVHLTKQAQVPKAVANQLNDLLPTDGLLPVCAAVA